MEVGEYFVVTFRVVDHFFPKKQKAPAFFRDEVDMGRGGVGGSGRVSVLSSFGALFAKRKFRNTETTRGGHNNFPDFYTLS